VRLVIISDTHGWHDELVLPEGDVLIHCGDLCDGVNPRSDELRALDAWFARQPFDHILYTGGNHDRAIQELAGYMDQPLDNALLLIDDSVQIDGVHFWGAPWVPDLQGWAFYADSSTLKAKWAEIPEDTDVLITHTPPAGVLDLPGSMTRHIGCQALTERLHALTPRAHCFGHVHASRGTQARGETTFVNAAVVGGKYPYAVMHAPIVIDI